MCKWQPHKKAERKTHAKSNWEPSLEENTTQETEGNCPPVFLVIEESNESVNSIQTSVQRWHNKAIEHDEKGCCGLKEEK